MKHNNFYKGIMIMLVISMMGCKKDLLESTPYAQSTSANFWRNSDDAVAASNALYTLLGAEDFFGHTEQTWDVTSDDQWRAGDHADEQAVEDFTYDGSSRGWEDAVWPNKYEVVSRANAIIINVPGIEMDNTLKNRILGEAYFMRALMYWQSYKIYGQVPIITEENVIKILGPSHIKDKYQGNDIAGVVTGLAWTQVGGDILYIETSLSKSKSGKLTLTGNLGEVMKESATLALEYLKAHPQLINADAETFENNNIHIHVPEGATPKDGPSAGIAMLTSLASAFTKRKVKKALAMTGEITLRGKVLPVGGIKEKILAAKRAGIKEIILCADNKKDIDDIKPEYLKGLTFNYVTQMEDVLKIALLKEKVKDI